jgi:hypothetical protein
VILDEADGELSDVDLHARARAGLVLRLRLRDDSWNVEPPGSSSTLCPSVTATVPGADAF